MRRGHSILTCCLTLALTSTTGEAFAENQAPSPSLDYYAAVGVRAYANDPTSLVLAGKAKVLDMGMPSLSVRAALLLGGYVEARAPLTIEVEPIARMAPFFGVGVAYGTDHLGAWDPMLTGGVDISLHRRAAINLTAYYIVQRSVQDHDKEIMAALAVVF